MEDAHCKSVDEVVNYFNVDADKGLSPDQVKRNQEKYGLNGKPLISTLGTRITRTNLSSRQSLAAVSDWYRRALPPPHAQPRQSPTHPASSPQRRLHRYRAISRYSGELPSSSSSVTSRRCSAMHACCSLALPPRPSPTTIAAYQPEPLATSSYTCSRSPAVFPQWRLHARTRSASSRARGRVWSAKEAVSSARFCCAVL